MKPKICQQCGSNDRVRKVTRKNMHWCWKCRSEKVPYSTIEEAREVFARRKRRLNIVITTDFDALYSEFSNDCKTFSEIAKSQGVSRELIRQLYMKYFNLIIPRRPDGMTRRKVCTLKKGALNRAERLRERFFRDPAAFALKSAVESLGLGIRAINVKGNARVVSIVGKRCTFHVCNKACFVGPINKKLYWRFRLNPLVLKRVEIVVLALLEGEDFRFFIVPVHKLPARFFEIRKYLHVPQGGVDPKGRGRRSDFLDVLEYENGWHYLDERKSPESQTINPSTSPA